MIGWTDKVSLPHGSWAGAYDPKSAAETNEPQSGHTFFFRSGINACFFAQDLFQRKQCFRGRTCPSSILVLVVRTAAYSFT